MDNYKRVMVAWHDEPSTVYATNVAIDPDWADKPDDKTVFFYFDSESEFESAKNQQNDFEFWILEELD